MVLAQAMRKAASEPLGPLTRDRTEFLAGLRSFHLRHARGGMDSKVEQPVHIIYYRAVTPGLIEIVRVLHERMEPWRHLDADR
jgi:toxin ParE1/3/4